MKEQGAAPLLPEQQLVSGWQLLHHTFTVYWFLIVFLWGLFRWEPPPPPCTAHTAAETYWHFTFCHDWSYRLNRFDPQCISTNAYGFKNLKPPPSCFWPFLQLFSEDTVTPSWWAYQDRSSAIDHSLWQSFHVEDGQWKDSHHNPSVLVILYRLLTYGKAVAVNGANSVVLLCCIGNGFTSNQNWTRRKIVWIDLAQVKCRMLSTAVCMQLHTLSSSSSSLYIISCSF